MWVSASQIVSLRRLMISEPTPLPSLLGLISRTPYMCDGLLVFWDDIAFDGIRWTFTLTSTGLIWRGGGGVPESWKYLFSKCILVLWEIKIKNSNNLAVLCVHVSSMCQLGVAGLVQCSCQGSDLSNMLTWISLIKRHCAYLITDRVRSTRGGNIFSLLVCSHPGGGVPTQVWMGGEGGTYSQVWTGGGVPTLRSGRGGGVHTLRSGRGEGGYLLSGLDGGGEGGTYSQVWTGGGGVPTLRSGRGEGGT